MTLSAVRPGVAVTGEDQALVFGDRAPDEIMKDLSVSGVVLAHQAPIANDVGRPVDAPFLEVQHHPPVGRHQAAFIPGGFYGDVQHFVAFRPAMPVKSNARGGDA